MSLILRFRDVDGRGTAPRILYRIRAKVFDNVYSLVFGPDGMLYIPSGFLGTSRPRGEDSSQTDAERYCASRAKGSRPATTRLERALPAYGPLASRMLSTSRSSPARTSLSPARAAQKRTTRSTSSCPAMTTAIPTTRARRLRRRHIALLDYGSNRTSPVGIIRYSGSKFPALRDRFLMCENHGQGLIVLRINPSNPGRLLNFTPIRPECTIDIVQTQDGSVVFSGSNGIYRLTQP